MQVLTTDETIAGPVPRAARVRWIDAGRGVAIAMVVLFHTANWLSAAGADVDAWIEFNTVVSSLRMPLFFALSGLFARKWVTGSWRGLWDAKLRLYLWVFVVWSVIGSFAFIAGVRMKGEGSLAGAVIPALTALGRPRLELWFIWALALFFVVARLTRKVPPWVQLTVAGLGAAVALSGWETASPAWSGSVKYYAFFLAGLHLREVVLRIGSSRRRVVLVAAALVWAAVSVGLWRYGLREVPGLYFVNCVLGIVAGIALARVLARFEVLRSIGSQTLPIYLAHTPVIIAVAVLLHLAGLTGGLVVVVALPLLLAVFAIATALRLRTVAERHGAGWLYSPPGWFFRPAVPARPAAGS